MAMACEYCGKDWVQPCWSAGEASTCGNLDGQAKQRAMKTLAAFATVDRARENTQRAVEDNILRMADEIRARRASE